MSFKIIQEFKKPGFIIIPEGFEKNGVFWYPPLSWSSKKRHNLLRNKFYLPDKSLWEARPCVVKKSRIESYELAEEHEETLLENNNSNSTVSFKSKRQDVIDLGSESSDEESFLGRTPKLLHSPIPEMSQSPKRKSAKNQPKEIGIPKVDIKLPVAMINDDIWNCFAKTSTPSSFLSRVQAMPSFASASATLTSTSQTPAIKNNTYETSHRNIESVQKIDKDISLDCDSESNSIGFNSAEKSNSLSTKILSKILKSQQNHQEEIAKQIKELKTCVQDGLTTVFMELETLTQIQYSNSLSSVNPDIYPKKFCIENFKKVSTCEEANRLEKMLMISEFKADMVEKMSNIIGSKGTRIGEGLDCCYDLIETVFQRKFLKICSWTGASTSQMEDAKIAFLKYKNIISFFASVILNADPGFSFERTKEFFKEVLRTNSAFLNPPNNRELSPIQTTTEEDDQQHQSWKSIKRKRIEEDQSESAKKEKALRNSAFGNKIDQILKAANKVLDNARELNLNEDDDDDDDDENDDENGDENEDENEADNEADNEEEKEDELRRSALIANE